MAAKAREKKTKPAAPKPPRKPGQKQPYLPGAEDMAPPSIPALDDAATDYRAARDARMQMGETELEAAAALLKLMHEHRLSEYEYDGYTVRVAVLEKVRVNKAKAESNGDTD